MKKKAATDRSKTNKAMTQRRLDEQVRKDAPGLVLRPRDFPPEDRQRQSTHARKAAEEQLAQIEKGHIKEAKDGFLRDQKRYLQKVRSSRQREEKAKGRKNVPGERGREFNRVANPHDPSAPPPTKEPSPTPGSPAAAKEIKKENPVRDRQASEKGGRGR